MNSSARFLVAAALLAVTAIFLHARSRNEVLPMRQPLKAFPQQLGEWSGTDVAISQDVLDVLGQGDFLLRVYQDDSGRNPDVDLFLAYFPVSAQAIPSIPQRIACRAPAGRRLKPAEFQFLLQDARLSWPIATSLPREPSGNSCSTGIGHTTGPWLASIWQNFTWSPIPSV